MEINIKKLTHNAIIPTRGSEEAAGYDLYTNSIVSHTLLPHTTTKISTGIALTIPQGYFGAIYARSGIATKKGLRPANCVGVIDSDYRGEIIVALHNDTDEIKIIEAKDRIAQLVIMPYLAVEFNEVNDLDTTKRGEGGFGSTNK